MYAASTPISVDADGHVSHVTAVRQKHSRTSGLGRVRARELLAVNGAARNGRD
jgi:hypothetical protein